MCRSISCNDVALCPLPSAFSRVHGDIPHAEQYGVTNLHSLPAGASLARTRGSLGLCQGNGVPNMAFEAVKLNRKERRDAEPKPAVPVCPICEGRMEVVYARNNQNVSVCTDCHSGLTVPGSAWDIVRIKHEAKWMPKP
jgi:hypothetical protein